MCAGSVPSGWLLVTSDDHPTKLHLAFSTAPMYSFLYVSLPTIVLAASCQLLSSLSLLNSSLRQKFLGANALMLIAALTRFAEWQERTPTEHFLAVVAGLGLGNVLEGLTAISVRLMARAAPPRLLCSTPGIKKGILASAAAGLGLLHVAVPLLFQWLLLLLAAVHCRAKTAQARSLQTPKRDGGSESASSGGQDPSCSSTGGAAMHGGLRQRGAPPALAKVVQDEVADPQCSQRSSKHDEQECKESAYMESAHAAVALAGLCAAMSVPSLIAQVQRGMRLPHRLPLASLLDVALALPVLLIECELGDLWWNQRAPPRIRFPALAGASFWLAVATAVSVSHVLPQSAAFTTVAVFSAARLIGL